MSWMIARRASILGVAGLGLLAVLFVSVGAVAKGVQSYELARDLGETNAGLVERQAVLARRAHAQTMELRRHSLVADNEQAAVATLERALGAAFEGGEVLSLRLSSDGTELRGRIHWRGREVEARAAMEAMAADLPDLRLEQSQWRRVDHRGERQLEVELSVAHAWRPS